MLHSASSFHPPAVRPAAASDQCSCFHGCHNTCAATAADAAQSVLPHPSAAALAKQELAPLALHAYCEAYSDFKHCMVALLAGGSGGPEAEAELRQFAGMVARAMRQELAAGGGGAAPASPPQLLQLLRYLLLLHKHQHHGGFHPYWWPAMSAASRALCGRLLLPSRDALPPPELDTGVQDSFGSMPPGVRETDVQALRTSLGCDREEAVTLLKCASRAGDLCRVLGTAPTAWIGGGEGS